MPVTKIKKTGSELPLSVIIPAAGKGTKKQSSSLEQLPGGELLVNYQIKTIRRAYRDSDIVLVVGYDNRNVIDNLTESVRIVENENYLHTNTARSIQLAMRVLPQIDNLLVVHGDVYLNEESIKHLGGGESCLVIDNLELQNESSVGIIQQNSRILRCTYKDFPKWGHIVYLKNREVKILQKILKNDVFEHCFTEELINLIIDEGGEFSAFSSPKTIAIEINQYDSKKLKASYSGATTTCRQ